MSPAVSVVFCFRFLGLLSSFLNHTHQRNAFASRTNTFVLSVPLLVKSRPENRPPMSAYARVRSVATLSPPSPQQTFTCTYIRLLSFPLFLGVCVRWFANMRRRTCGVNRVCQPPHSILPCVFPPSSFIPGLALPRRREPQVRQAVSLFHTVTLTRLQSSVNRGECACEVDRRRRTRFVAWEGGGGGESWCSAYAAEKGYSFKWAHLCLERQ